MRTNVYVDAFNLYYGCVKGTPYKWLDLATFFSLALPRNQINRIRYFTAPVKARPHDPQQPTRQQAYIRALLTLPNLTVHYGQFLESTATARLATPLPDGTNTVRVIKTEEKGSDVNIACHLLVDAFDGDYDAAVIVSNDSDLTGPIDVVRKRFKKKIVVLMPCGGGRRMSVDLQKVASKAIPIDPAHLAASQFPPQLSDAHGVIRKPASW